MGIVKEIEERRLIAQGQLDRQRSPSERNRSGQFATPSALALDIVGFARELWMSRNDSAKFLDPAIGTGSFYSAFRNFFPKGMIAEAVGIELDPAVATVASSLWKRTGLNVTIGDFTRQTPPAPGRRANLVLTNPPYVRHHHMSQTEKLRLQSLVRQALGLEISGLAGLYCYFLLLSHSWMDDGGLAIWLIPSEFMDVNYGAAIRTYLATQVTLLQIHRYYPSDVQFADALVSSAVVVFRKSKPLPGEHSVAFSFGGRISEPHSMEDINLGQLCSARKWTQFPGTLKTELRSSPHAPVLGDLFAIKRGIATGANNFFILARQDADRFGVPEECTKAILPGPRHLGATIIEASPSGKPRLKEALLLIDCDYTEEVIRERFPRFWTYLESGMKKGIHKRYLTSRRIPWYSQEVRPPAPFLCTYMGRPSSHRNAFRFIWNQSKATAPNVYLLLYPKEPLRELLGESPGLYSRVFEVLQGFSDKELLPEGRVYGGGLHKLEPRELARVTAQAIVDAIDRLTVQRQMNLFH